jgi:hypothetical protein
LRRNLHFGRSTVAAARHLTYVESGAADRIVGSIAGLLPHLAHVVYACRLAAGATVLDVAHRAGVDASTVYRFERARAWPRDPDTLLCAYAAENDDDPTDLWQQAIDAWRRSR